MQSFQISILLSSLAGATPRCFTLTPLIGPSNGRSGAATGSHFAPLSSCTIYYHCPSHASLHPASLGRRAHPHHHPQPSRLTAISAAACSPSRCFCTAIAAACFCSRWSAAAVASYDASFDTTQPLLPALASLLLGSNYH